MSKKKDTIVAVFVMITGALIVAYTYVTKESFFKSDSVFGLAGFLFGVRILIAVPGKEMDPHKRKKANIIQILVYLLAFIGVILTLSEEGILK
ncbi:MAG: hypothetical protein WC980_09635 [Candidatus Brocadiia bacterium]